MPATEVVITGVGVVSPIGIGKEAFWQSLRSGRSGVKRLAHLEEAGFPVRTGAPVEGFQPKEFVANRKSLKVMARDAQFGVAVALMACRDAGVLPGGVGPERLGVVLGGDRITSPLADCESSYGACLVGGRFEFSRWGKEGMAATFPLTFLTVLPNMTASHVAIALDARGPNNTIHQGDVSGLLAITEAARVIQRGAADAIVAGGVSCRQTPFDWSRQFALGRLSQSDGDPAAVMRPFDARRDGEVHGEGAGALVLESRAHAEARRARILATLVGWAAACDPPRGWAGLGLRQSAHRALAQAGLAPADIDHVNAHGASTIADDAIEAQALAEALPGVPVTAPKSYFGNLGSAGGAVEMIAGLMGFAAGQVPGTLNFRCPDPACPVEVVRAPRAPRRPAWVAVNRTPQGQSAAVVLAAP